MSTFTELLEEYLGERDRQNNGYYDGRWLGSSIEGREYMEKIALEMDKMVDPKLKEKQQ